MNVGDLMHRDVVTIEESEDLSTALQLMGWNGIRHLPVVRGGGVVGMLSERDVLARVRSEDRLKVTGSVADAMSAPVKRVPRHMDVNEAAGLMVGERIDALPVVEEGRLLGIVTSTDLLGHVAQCDVQPAPASETTIGQLMIRKVQAAYDDDPLGDAAARMAQHGIRHLPVVDGMMRVKGIVSERDVREATGKTLVGASQAERAAYIQRLRVRDVMTEDPRTVGENEPVSTAVRAFVEDRFGALPVVDDEERLLGIVSYVDLLRYLGARLAEDASGREQREARA